MNILITGAGGLLGQHLATELKPSHRVTGCRHSDLDITKADSIAQVFDRIHPDIVVNCAAMTAVDACESERERAFQSNAIAPQLLAVACRQHSAQLVHISTDYVFDGSKDGLYEPEDKPNPISVYGQSKLEGEVLVQQELPSACIVRVAGLYGKGGRNFASQLGTLLRKPGTLRSVADNRILTGYAVDVAARLRELIEGHHTGLFHVTNSGTPCSWYELALFGAEVVGADVQAEILPVTEAELNRPAPRPMNSALGCSTSTQLGFKPLRDWKEALVAYLSGCSLFQSIE
ncbi:MAG: dTDP-4-dehydrorhamnose reductase [Acidobacteria bacterium]|nr:dTDP-4-dehydrorhamnose reductase [Acidobacteriota bacterium]